MQRRQAAIALALAVSVAGAGIYYARSREPSVSGGANDAGTGEPRADASVAGRNDADATYVGSARCTECHDEQGRGFAGSDHDRAIEVPSPGSVEAPFDGATFTHHGVETTFRTTTDPDGDGTDPPRYVVTTQGADGSEHSYPVAWTFGFEPLQQYLLDVGGGRLQSLTIAWDSRPSAEGGQRFYSLYPDEHIPPDDTLHWTGPMQNWNYVCADCHSTAYEKRYDPETDTFEPTWTDLDVGCEACHGPGSHHVRWAEEAAESPDRAALGDPSWGLVVNLTNGRDWQITDATHNATPQPDATHREIETCAPCHSRRHQVAELKRPDQPMLDFYRPELLDEPLYHPDGQIDGEVYVYGSFTQSRMFHAGVRCSDCHDPHTLQLRFEGDALCGQCHDTGFYAASSHHHHADDGPGARCVSCHMPAQVYMGVDARRDHSMRVPRPDLSVSLGAPNACTACHEGPSFPRGQDAAWAAESAGRWWPGERPPHFGPTLLRGRRGDPEALEALVALANDIGQPGIVRGTALMLLEGYGEAARGALAEGARDGDPLLRLGAVLGAGGLPPGPRLAVVAPLLTDTFRVLRIEAARALAIAPRDALRDDVGEALDLALGELRESELLHADRSDAWLRISIVETDRGRLAEAEAALRRSLEVAPGPNPARVNLADLARIRGDEAEAERWLRGALELDPEDPEALHALGLHEIRSGRAEEAIDLLVRASDLRPENPRFAYVAAVALWEQGNRGAARTTLDQALERHPFDASLNEARRAYGVGE